MFKRNVILSGFSIIVIILFSVWVIKPFFAQGFFPIHDNTQVQRVFEMRKALSDGMFPVRWVQDLGYGYGYPIFNFYAPLAYYLGGFVSLIGLDVLFATKVMMITGIVASGLTMFMLAKEFWGKTGGVIAGLLYLYAPYHALDIYVRGDVAEFWAYAFIPLVFLSLYKLYCHSRENGNPEKEFSNLKSQKSKPQFKIQKSFIPWIIIGALSFAAIVLSHNLTAMMVTPFLLAEAILFIIITNKKNRLHLISYILYLFILGLLLSSFYWLPTLREMKYTNVLSQVGGGADFHDHFVCPLQLWDSPWGFGGSAPGCIDGLSFRIGKVHVVFALVSFLVLAVVRKKDNKKFKFIVFTFIALLSTIFLMLEISTPVWNTLTPMAFFQYPWRFLLLTSFFTSFLGGGIIWYLRDKRFFWFFAVLVIAIIIFFNSKLFVPQTINNVASRNFIGLSVLIWTTSKISDEYMPKNFSKPKNKNEIPAHKINLDNRVAKTTLVNEKTQEVLAEINAKQDTRAVINLAYFPAWHIFLDDQEVAYQVFNKGFIVQIPEGSHLLDVKFTQTRSEIAGNILSLTGVIILIIGIILWGKEKMHVKKNT